jgi:hypothetical protein
MSSAWDLAQEVKIRTLGDNLFVMKFSYLVDLEKVTEGGPWTFRGNTGSSHHTIALQNPQP